MLIGILQTGRVPEMLAPQEGEYPQMFAEMLAGRGLRFASWAVVDGEALPEPEAADGWLITGSRHGAYEDHAWLPPLRAFIRAVMATDRPLVGVCFGHQIIAQAMGAPVQKSNQGWIVGARDYAFPGETLRLNAWHQDQVLEVPEGAEILATSPGCPIAALHYPGHALTVQPHPEIRRRYLEGLLTHRAKGLVPDALQAEARAHLDDPVQADRMADMFETFFRERRVS